MSDAKKAPEGEVLEAERFAQALAEAVYVAPEDWRPTQKVAIDRLTRDNQRLHNAIDGGVTLANELAAKLAEAEARAAKTEARLARAVGALREAKDDEAAANFAVPDCTLKLIYAVLAEHDNESTNGAQAPGVGGAAETGASVRVGASGDAGPTRLEQVQLLPLDAPLVERAPPPGAKLGKWIECEHCQGGGCTGCQGFGGFGYEKLPEPAPPKPEAVVTCAGCLAASGINELHDCEDSKEPTRDELVAALREMVGSTERWNAVVEKLIGRQAQTGIDLIEARALLARIDGGGE